MITASICTIGDEILIGQIVDTNSSAISRILGGAGIKVDHMISIGDAHDTIISTLAEELRNHEVVIVTGGLGPTKDDITKKALYELSGSTSYVNNPAQEEVVKAILKSRGLDMLECNRQQSMVPDKCEVIVNKLGTAPIMAFHFEADGPFGHACSLYSAPGVPFETLGAMPDVMANISSRFSLSSIYHRTVMTYGMAESALAARIADWESALPADMHLAYLPNTLTGVRLRLSIYGGGADAPERAERQIEALKAIIGDIIYSDSDSSLEAAIGDVLRGSGCTLSAAESCTGGEIAHLITTVSGSSEYFLGSVTSYAVAVKEKVLGVDASIIEKNGIVSSAVATAMAQGVRKLTGSTFSVATTGWADSYGDEREPAGTVWVAVSTPSGTTSKRFQYRNGRKQNIERFAASALNFLLQEIKKELL